MSFVSRAVRRLYILFNTIILRCNKCVSIGENFNFRYGFRVNCADSGKLIIGNNVFFNNDCSINVHKCVQIGDNCIFGENVKIYDHNHIFCNKGEPIYKQGFSDKAVKIGNNCWIGSNTVILPNTVIGDNVVIGAGTVVKGDIVSDNVVIAQRDYKCMPIEYRSKK